MRLIPEIHSSEKQHRCKESQVRDLTRESSCVLSPSGCFSTFSGSSVHGILQARILGWVAISSSRRENGSVQFSSVQSLSYVRLFVTPWITACQAFLSITNSRSSLKFTSIESMMPSSNLILYRPLFLLPSIPPSISLFQWVNSSHEVAKVLEFQL